MAIDDGDKFREGITEYLQREAPSSKEDGAVCTGYVIITEWMGPDGDRWLAKAHAANVAHWAAKGMMHEALYGDWPDGSGE